jgi:xanthine dehydrogenase YagR molybdenum-binding subunit
VSATTIATIWPSCHTSGRPNGAFAGGHIANTRTARSQLMGGMIWGTGSALHESTEMDKAAARYINDN